MPDLSAALPTPELVEAFLGVVDVEGKLLAALDDLGPVAGRDVVVLDAGRSNLVGIVDARGIDGRKGQAMHELDDQDNPRLRCQRIADQA